MKTLGNYLKYHFGKPNEQSAYARMRYDYINSNIINKVSKVNSWLNPKYKISSSEGVLGVIDSKKVQEIKNQIDRDGFYIFPNKLDQNKVKEIKEIAKNSPLNILEVSKDTIKYSDKTYLYSESKGMSNRYQFMDASNFINNQVLKDLVLDANFLHIANEYLGCKPVMDIITMWWSNDLSNVKEEDKEILISASAQMFHIDMDRLKFLKFFVYLTDVNTNNGPHVYVKSSHKQIPPYIKKDGRYTDEFISDNDGENILEICGEAGSIIAVDTRGLHKGKELIEGERLIFQVEFANSLFGNPQLQKVSEKISYTGNAKYFETYRNFFKN